MKRLNALISLIVSFNIGFVVTLSSLLLAAEVFTPADLRHVKFGLPFSFVIQDLSRIEPNFPWRVGLSSPWEYPTALLPGRFTLSVLMIAAGTFIITYPLLNRFHPVNRR